MYYIVYIFQNDFQILKNMVLLQVALIDQDKGNIMDIKNKKYVRAIPVWGGACSSDGRYGMYFKIF